MRVIADDVVAAQPLHGRTVLGGQQRRDLSQRVLGDAVQRGGIARGVFVNGALPVADLVHGTHDGDVGAATLEEILNEVVMGGQVLDVGRRVVHEAVTPREVQDHVRASELVVDVSVAAENLGVDAARTLVDTVEAEVDDADVEAALQQGVNNVAANVATGSGNEDSLHHVSQSIKA